MSADKKTSGACAVCQKGWRPHAARARERERPARGREGGVERHVRGVHAVEQLGGLGVEPERGGQRAHLRRAGE